MTPEEAKTKWCPFAGSRAITHYADSQGRDLSVFIADSTGERPVLMCIGHSCMAWRVNRDYSGDSGGYCGLAGKEGAPI